jgi:hypothetical protein
MPGKKNLSVRQPYGFCDYPSIDGHKSCLSNRVYPKIQFIGFCPKNPIFRYLRAHETAALP